MRELAAEILFVVLGPILSVDRLPPVLSDCCAGVLHCFRLWASDAYWNYEGDSTFKSHILQANLGTEFENTENTKNVDSSFLLTVNGLILYILFLYITSLRQSSLHLCYDQDYDQSSKVLSG